MDHNANNDKNNNDRSSSSFPSSSPLGNDHQNKQDRPRFAGAAIASSSSWPTTPWTAMAAASAAGTTWMGAAVMNTRSRRNNTKILSSSMLKNLTNISQHLALHGLVHGAGSDISLLAFGKTYRLHRLVLLQATFFENMLQGPWQENNKDTVDMTFDDPNITQEGFDIAIGRLYGIWAVEREDEGVAESGEYELDIGAEQVDEQIDKIATHSPSHGGLVVPPSILSPQNVLSVLAVAAYLGIESLCEQCADFAIRTLRTDHLLSYIEFSHQSDYYPWSDKIIEACHSYLCRNGFADPKMVCLQVFEQLPLDWLIKIVGSDAFWVPSEWERYEFCRQIVHRRRAISSIVRSLPSDGNSSSSVGTRSGSSVGTEPATAGGADRLVSKIEEQEHEDQDEMAYEALFSSGIIYMHMSFEQLQCIQRDIDPISGLRFVRSSVIQEALWHQIEFRNLIETHGPKEPNNRRNNSRVGSHSTVGPDGSSTIGLVTSNFPGDFDEGYEGSDWIRRPFAIYKPIPEGDTTLTGEDDEPTLQELATWNQLNHPSQSSASGSAATSASRVTSTISAAVPAALGGTGSSGGSGSNANSSSFWSPLLSRRHRQLSPPSNPGFIQLAKKQRIMDPVSEDAGGNSSGSGLSGVSGALEGVAGVERELNGQYPIYPPFRFSVAFRNIQSLKENTRVCSDAFFYAGSYWNLYIQKIPTGQPGGMQLGVYLHRHSLPTVPEGVRRKSGLPHVFTPSSPSHVRSRTSLGGPIIYRGAGKGDQYIDLPTLPMLTEQLRLLQQSSAFTARAGPKSSAATPAEGGSGDNSANGAEVDVTNAVTAAAAVLFEDSFSCFVDKRETTKTWFKIYAIGLGPVHEVTQFQSSPDDFAVMQSWGWRSWNLCLTAYLPESPVPKDDVGIKLQTGCHCTGLLVSSPDCYSLEEDAAATTASIPPAPLPGSDSLLGHHHPASTTVVAAVVDNRAGSVAPVSPATAAVRTASTTTTTVTDTAMDVDYVHEYEFDENNPQKYQKQEGQGPSRIISPGTRDGDSVGTNARLQAPEASGPPVAEPTSSHAGCRCGYASCTGVLDGGSACGNHVVGGGDRIFIRAPLGDTFATDQYAHGATVQGGEGGSAQAISCNCEAQSRYGPEHHHHPLQATRLQFSIVMGHV
ncbi:hypothetical protein BGZ47_006670 [Haplosporangium gracile]|nr:hypothetical protein BGZ47_006670 [Haplosporangium gracile]